MPDTAPQERRGARNQEGMMTPQAIGVPWEVAPNGDSDGIYNCRGELMADAESPAIAAFIVETINAAPDYVLRELVAGLASHLEKAQRATTVIARHVEAYKGAGPF